MELRFRRCLWRKSFYWAFSTSSYSSLLEILKFLIFATYIIIQTFFLMSFRGVGFEILWPNSVEWHHKSIPFLSGLVQGASVTLVLAYLPVASAPPLGALG